MRLENTVQGRPNGVSTKLHLRFRPVPGGGGDCPLCPHSVRACLSTVAGSTDSSSDYMIVEVQKKNKNYIVVLGVAVKKTRYVREGILPELYFLK